MLNDFSEHAIASKGMWRGVFFFFCFRGTLLRLVVVVVIISVISSHCAANKTQKQNDMNYLTMHTMRATIFRIVQMKHLKFDNLSVLANESNRRKKDAKER